MSSPAGAEQAVAALFAERQQYEGWLSTLEAKRDATPNHIYDRVHADYRARLQRTMEQLRSHRSAVQEMENALADRLTLLDIEEAKQKDERSEAELRAAVGELTPEQCRAVIQRCDEAIAALEGDRSTVGFELARLRSVLDGPPSPLEAAPAGAPVERQRTPAESSAVDARFAAEEQRPSVSRGGFDELQFLKSVVESPSGEQDAIGAGAVSNGGDMSMQSSLSMPTPPMPAPRVTPPSVFEQASMQAPAILGEARRGNGNGTQGSTAFVKDAPPEQVKSLKCQECGTLNYPTEWYCERCGAELAAL